MALVGPIPVVRCLPSDGRRFRLLSRRTCASNLVVRCTAEPLAREVEVEEGQVGSVLKFAMSDFAVASQVSVGLQGRSFVQFESGALASGEYPKQKDYCFGFQNGGLQSKDGKDIFLLGDLVLSNQFIVYDLENQVIGWTEYNCSSSIKVEGDNAGTAFTVDAHNIGSAWRSESQNSILLLLLTIVFTYMFF